MSGASDTEVQADCIEFDRILITINGKDFRRLCGNPDQLHPGFVIIPSVAKANQIRFIKAALAQIDQEAPPETPQDWMVNRVVEMDFQGRISHVQLPGDRTFQAQTQSGCRRPLPPRIDSGLLASLPSSASGSADRSNLIFGGTTSS